MRTIHTRTYTNAALTVLILLLAALALRPYVSLPTAQARSTEFAVGEAPASADSAQRTSLLKDPYADVAKGLVEIANSNRDVAAAIRETAKSQDAVAKAITILGNPAAAPKIGN